MKGEVFQRNGSPRWYIRYYLPPDPANPCRRRRIIRVGGTTKREAESALAEALHQVRTESHTQAPGRLSVGEYLLRWLEDYARPRVRPRTYEHYRQVIRNHLIPSLGLLRLDQLRPIHVERYLAAKIESGRQRGEGGLSPRTVLHHYRVLSEAMKRARIWQVIARDPCENVQPPRVPRKGKSIIRAGDFSAMLDMLEGKRLFIPVLLAMATGARRGEILALRWRDVDLEQGFVSFERTLSAVAGGELVFGPTKSNRGVRVALPPFAVAELRAARDGTASFERNAQTGDLLIRRPDGRPWHPDSFTSEFRRFVLEKWIPAGYPRVTFHGLRHSHATALLSMDVHLKVIQERLGHSSIGITADTYTAVMPGIQREAAEKLESAFRGV